MYYCLGQRKDSGGCAGLTGRNGDIQCQKLQAEEGYRRHWNRSLEHQNPEVALRCGAEKRVPLELVDQGVTKRCRQSSLTNSALVKRVQMRGEGGSCWVSANENSCAHHVTRSPNKLWRSTSMCGPAVYFVLANGDLQQRE